jgi:preprotein translocase subunit SecE
MIDSVSRFLSEVKLEIQKVTWPSYNELVGSSIIVFILVVAFALYLGGIDLVFYSIAEWLFS